VLRPQIEAALAQVGVARPFGRDAGAVLRADGQDAVSWTIPLQRDEAEGLTGIVRTAAIIVVLAVSGMRSSEVMELRAGARLPLEEPGPGLIRYRLASKVIKGQPLGGTEDQWVVIEPVYRAVELAEQLHDNPQDGAPLLGRFAFSVRYKWFRNWVNGPAGQRLGLVSIPGDLVTPRMLRRTLAIELAYRPRRPARGETAPQAHLRGDDGGVRFPSRRRPGRASGRGQQARGRP
jgi:integrase